MAETTEVPPVIPQPAPSTALPKLDGITQEDLQREIRGDAPPAKETEKLGGKSHVEERVLEGFGSAAQEMIKKKVQEGDKPVDDAAGKEDKEPEAKEKKPVVSADDAQPPKTEQPADGRLPDDQLQVLPHDKPLTKRRIEQLLKDKADLMRERDEARAAAKANPTPSNVEEYNKLKEEHAKANDELIKFRRRYEIENDETFKKTYDEPISAAESAIEATLKKYQLGDATLKVIKDEGGFAAFSRSSKTFPIVEIDPETQEKKTVMRTAAELARGWINNIAVADGEFIKSALGKQAMLEEEKKQATERAVGESRQFFEARQKQQAEQQAAANKTNEELKSKHEKMVKETMDSTEWLKDKDVPANATEEQKKKIADHNDFNKQLRARLADNPDTVEKYMALKVDAAHSHHLRRELGDRDSRIKSLEAEVARLKGAGRTTPKGGSLLSDAGKPAKKEDNVAPEDFKSGFRKAAQARMGGDDE